MNPTRRKVKFGGLGGAGGAIGGALVEGKVAVLAAWAFAEHAGMPPEIAANTGELVGLAAVGLLGALGAFVSGYMAEER